MNIENIYYKLIEKINPESILKNEPMSKHTSFKIGGPVDLMVLPKTIEDIKETIQICKTNHIDYYIIGNGSNILVLDKGIRGVVIKIGDTFNGVDIKENEIKAKSGILLSSLASIVVKNGLEGFEFASGIPGTLGGAIAMNAGAYGGEMKDVVKAALVMDEEGNMIYLKKEELELDYRNSIIPKKKYIVLEVEIELQKGDEEEIKAKVKDLTQKRVTKQPLQFPSAGSTFKRPQGHFAGKLIEDAGLKGVRIGGAQVSPLHAGFVVNVDRACAEDVMNIISLVQKTVYDKFSVLLEPEIKIIGEE
ncbi:UDP-N-acetylmuramate dehydrogenase [Inediibacterium massiliense]|uniref:UDP-N-acetylmuramate dehydrogenase n=1 Tax=Inediibacterium massiliense TaxID=1658111 RepID=UPI0006B67DF5|nr:UDP-N-acetylmuramate dehydrogenase [Inediibacterium massiliense]